MNRFLYRNAVIYLSPGLAAPRGLPWETAPTNRFTLKALHKTPTATVVLRLQHKEPSCLTPKLSCPPPTKKRPT
jgi:hypothetical protein